MNKSGFLSAMGTILYEGPLFLSPLRSTSKNKKGCIRYPIRLRAIVLHFSLWSYLTHSNSAPTATSESFYRGKHICASFYIEPHIMRKIWRRWTGDKGDLYNTERRLATDFAE